MDCEINKNQLPVFPIGEGPICLIDQATRMMKIASEGSCGRCVLCREGTYQVYEIFKGITEGKGKSDDQGLVVELLETIRSHADCDMSKEAATKCLEWMSEDPEEWDRHIKRGRCTPLICKGSYTVYIDPTTCDGCGICMTTCQTGAIRGESAFIHVIDQQKCTKALSCMAICPKGAIKKAGPVKPKLPTDPIPISSLSSQSGEDQENTGNMRRRRR